MITWAGALCGLHQDSLADAAWPLWHTRLMRLRDWSWLGCGLVLFACNDRPRTEPGPEPASITPPPAVSAKPRPKPPSPAPEATAEAEPTASAGTKDPADGTQSLPKGWLLDELTDVAPAGPVTATRGGLVLVTRDNRTHFARYSRPPPNSPPGNTEVAPLEIPPEQLVALRRGPALLNEHAYWIDGSKLLRRSFRGEGELEVLATDARHSTRVSAPTERLRGEPALVAYIAGGPKPDSPLKAKLWVEGSGTLQVSDDTSTANSVSITRSSTGLVVLALEARTGMTPIHARSVSFKGEKPSLGEDLVVWVGGPADPLTEVVGGSYKHQRLGFVALARTSTEFGLATLQVGDRPRMGAAVHWLDYPNGIDPAPVAAATLCKRPVVLFAAPATAAPRALQELRLGFVTGGDVGSTSVLARSRGFANISIAGSDQGALIAYTADRRTWARALRCR